ncbi:hypothetical protein K491DRAFT_34916 [Lophiostoma macrostomum CBS 122681]|uniref:Secreted protein n=1 Tax=Lophiostoma macrostomum CBS 122681 TaxID=1314788 RepID=A0A6A6SY66_9PLEO|nr:hypothetical protein K491DRAFT_34916 [Lophiostoma macrostomum CBS 122681]
MRLTYLGLAVYSLCLVSSTLCRSKCTRRLLRSIERTCVTGKYRAMVAVGVQISDIGVLGVRSSSVLSVAVRFEKLDLSRVD